MKEHKSPDELRREFNEYIIEKNRARRRSAVGAAIFLFTMLFYAIYLGSAQ